VLEQNDEPQMLEGLEVNGEAEASASHPSDAVDHVHVFLAGREQALEVALADVGVEANPQAA